METVGQIITQLNNFFDQWIVWPILAAILILDIRITYRWANRDARRRIALGEQPSRRLYMTSTTRALYLVSLVIALEAIAGVIFWRLTYPSLRWIFLYLVIDGLVYLITRKNSGTRGVVTAMVHLAILNTGWIVGKWLGMLFVSMPILVALYYWIYRLSLFIVPASNPEDRAEQRRRFRVLVYYLWGIQFPVWVVKDIAGRVIEERIRGDYFKDFGQPGIIITKSHQAVALSYGLSFSRVEGPGIIFTGPYERPHEVFDLRTQIRVSAIQAISKDGIEFRAFVLIVFRIDRDAWNDNEYKKLRAVNRLLRGGKDLDRTQGSYHYSRARVQAALAVQGVTASSDHVTEVKWDHWVVRQVEDIVREQLSEHSLDELWRPREDSRDVNALNKIAEKIKSRAAPLLRQHGIQLFASKVVNFDFPDEKTRAVVTQQIINWQSLRDYEIRQTRIEAKAKAVRIKQNAVSYARRMLLSYITEGLEMTADLHKGIPKKYLIAMRFLSAIEEWIRQHPDMAASTAMRMLQYRIRKFRSGIAP